MNDSPRQPGPSGALRPPDPIETPMRSFDLNAELEQLRRESAWQSGRSSKLLVKHSGFRVILMALKSGARLNEHKNAGRISVQTVSGHIRMQVEGTVFDLPTGHILALDREVMHDVEAIEESAFLLTIALPQENSEN